MPISSVNLDRIAGGVIDRHNQDASATLSGGELLAVLADLGARTSGQAADVLGRLRDAGLPTDAKIALIQAGMDAEAKKDAAAILDEGKVPLSDDARAILSAVLGRNGASPARALDDIWAKLPKDLHTPGGATTPVKGTGSASARGALLRLHIDQLSDAPSTTEVGKRIAESIRDRVVKLSSISGTGVEHWGQGDPDIVERRDLLSQLFDQGFVQLESIRGGWVKTDKEALERIQRTDAIAIRAGGYDMWSNLRTQVDKVREKNETTAKEAATKLRGKEAAFFEANGQTFSTRILGELEGAGDQELRSQTMVDLLLQLREPIDKTTEKEKMYGGGEGVQAVLELRQNATKVDPTLGDAAVERDYALTRALALANPRRSGNAVLEARHLISNIRRLSWQLVYGGSAVGAGMKISPYSAIHHNFSTETPKVISHFVGTTIFGGGSPESFCILVDAMGLASGGKGAEARALLAGLATSDPDVLRAFDAYTKGDDAKDLELAKQIEGFLVSRCKGKLDSGDISDPNLTDDERSHLRNGNVSSVKGKYDEKLTLVARLYRAVCKSMPTAGMLGDMMFSGAQENWPKVANVITHLELGAPPAQTLSAISAARAWLRDTVEKNPEGFRRLDAWALDQKLELLASSYLGRVVEQIGEVDTEEQRILALSAMKSALEGAAHSGLHQIRDVTDPVTGKGPTIPEAIEAVGGLFAKGEASVEDYRHVMGVAYEAIVKTTENLRAYIDRRVPDVSEGKLIPNPAFMDDLVKEGPLHYARAIAQKALRVGLKQEISAERIVNPDGVAVLNNLGRVVFDRVVLADTMADVKEIGADRDDFVIVRTMDEKKMAAVGGVMSNFPGGYSHAAVYARGAGMAALSNPDIGAAWEAFVQRCEGDKLYYDDSGGTLMMMPFKEAVARGLAVEGDQEKLKPGSNRHVEYVAWDEAVKQWKTIGTHDVKVHPDRPTHTIKIYTPAQSIKGLGEKAVSFQEAGPLGIDGRGLGGEKNTVLAMMSVEDGLKDIIPPGSYIPTTRCFKVLEDAGILGKWREPYEHDPIVGTINDSNFLQSRFYTDAAYRRGVREELLGLVKTKVRESLIGADGQPTEKGKALLDEIKANPAMAATENWIMRSSFTAEDRPYKSGAGQYDSVPNCRTDVERLEGVVTVLASAWDSPPIENNVVEEYNLMHIQPSITAMKCLNAGYSGVMISRDSDTGRRRTVSYQVVEGFGGGVEHGITEEGRISEGHNDIKRTLPGKDKTILGDGIDARLWQAAMEVERLFHKKIEPGKGYAVDMEWVFDKDDQKLYVVQARTVRV